MDTHVRLEPWGEDDFWLLERKNTPEMTAHLGGPETAEKLASRQRRYAAMSAGAPEAGRMFKVVLVETGETAGSVGYWPRVWDGEDVYETGWGVLPEFQGRGVAVAAARAVVAHVGALDAARAVHAFPSVDHAASNAVCRAAGFRLLGTTDFEYPPGHWHPTHNWRSTPPPP
ncbi:GNAT family N-acetyltransferase [Streptomyces sp. NBC_00239]|uniref:GNAT family N-acetyltransferase n=1 Tax=Streptomyces sp. NBC_00239 TaxID=2903640 RepID=UPI002E2CE206|nr:GNAT family protein [Streptomyces sp. NBC_00239]